MGADYPTLQQRIRDSIPALINTTQALNTTLQEKALILREKQAVFDQVDSDYNHDLSIWMPVFWLVPLGVGVTTCLALMYCKCSRKPEVIERDLEGQKSQYDSQPARSNSSGLFATPFAHALATDVAADKTKNLKPST